MKQSFLQFSSLKKNKNLLPKSKKRKTSYEIVGDFPKSLSNDKNK